MSTLTTETEVNMSIKKELILILASFLAVGICTAQTPVRNGLKTLPVWTPLQPGSTPASPSAVLILATPSKYANTILHPDATIDQVETSIAANPSSSVNLMVSDNAGNAVAQRFFIGDYHTSNRGVPGTWSGSDTLADTWPVSYSDPTVAYDLNGNAYDSYIQIGYNYVSTALSLNSSSNGGLSWNGESILDVTAASHPDRPRMVVDQNPTSSFKNLKYIGWTDDRHYDAGDTVSPNPIWVIPDTIEDDGYIYGPYHRVTGDSGYYIGLGINLAVGPNGELYSTWQYVSSYSSWFGSGIGFNKSTNGGRTWYYTSKHTIPISGYSSFIVGYLNKVPGNQYGLIHMNGFPTMAVDTTHGPNRGAIYIAYPNASDAVNHLKPDIMVIKSTDGGTTWSNPKRVNNDTSSVQTDQFYPWINVDPYGGVNVAFFDSRVDPTNNQLTQVYLARSTDGGNSFANYQISDTAFTPLSIPGTNYYWGDNIGVTSTKSYVFVSWYDNRRGKYQVFSARFPIYSVTASIYGAWNMASIPDTVSNLAKTAVWPTATSTATYWDTSSGSYKVRDTLKSGEGYFIKFAHDSSITYIGAPIYSMGIHVASNSTTYWNMIGSVSGPVATSAIVQSPSGIISGPIFKYNGSGYVVTDTVKPGMGIWLKVTQSGILTLTNNSIPKERSTRDILSELDKFTVTDGMNHQQEMFVANRDERRGIIGQGSDISDIEMPPPPPDELFDARFTSNNYVQTVTATSDPEELPIAIRDGIFPITVNWELQKANNLCYWMEAGGGRQFISGKGSLTMRDPTTSVVHLFVQTGKAAGVVPSSFSLNQNYPNPFNPTTEIEYSLPEDTHVSLKVYDVLGRVVETLVDGFETAGYKTAKVDGMRLSSGLYFYSLDAGRFSSTKKMLLIK